MSRLRKAMKKVENPGLLKKTAGVGLTVGFGILGIGWFGG